MTDEYAADGLWQGTLILVPTEIERREVCRAIADDGLPVHLCGFGPVVAGARSAQLVARLQPRDVVLLGVAGSLADEPDIGRALEFDAVACYGIGVGAGKEWVSAQRAGWLQWPTAPTIGDVLPLGVRLCDPGAVVSDEPEDDARLLLTACSASASAAEVAEKRQAFPAAVAEDMESFAVAAACRLAGVPLRVIRGISNRAGDRGKSRWQIAAAAQAAARFWWEHRTD